MGDEGGDEARETPGDDAEVEITEVEIFGSVYRVRGRDDSEYLREVATLVDGKMREVARQTASVDTSRIAILAALNIADEYLQSRSTREKDRVEIRQRVTALTQELSGALGG